MSASVLTYKGRENIANAVNGTSAVPKYIGWGTNAGGVDTYVAAKTDIGLFTPAAASGSNRATGVTSIVTVTTTNDGFQTVGTLTCTGAAIGVCEVALFDSATSPTVGTVAAAGVVGSSTATTLNTSAAFSPGNNNYIQIRTEVMQVTAGSGTTALTVTRNQNGSGAIATIAVGDTVVPGNPPGQTGIAGGNCFAHADFAVINLNVGDSIQFTVQYSTTQPAMGYGLVGSVGAVTQGSGGASVTPAWGTGETRSAGNLLLLWVATRGTGTLPTTPSGWSIATQIAQGTNCTANLYYLIAAGSDAAPTIAGIASTVISAQLAEFSGNTASPLDKTGTTTGSTSPVSVAATGADAASGDLVAVVASGFSSANGVVAWSDSLNNGATANSTNNNSANVVSHYDFVWGVTTGNAAADSDSVSWTGALGHGAFVIASFAAAAGSTQYTHTVSIVGASAVTRTAAVRTLQSVSGVSAVAVVKLGGKVLATVGAATVTGARSVTKTLALSGVSAVTFARAIRKALNVGGSGGIVLLRQVGKATAVTGVSLVTTIQQKVRLVTVGVVGVGSLAVVKSVNASRSLTGVGGVPLGRAISKALALNGTATLGVVRRAAKQLTVSGVSAVTTVQAKVRLVTVAVTGTSQLGVSKAVLSVRALSGVSTVAVRKLLISGAIGVVGVSGVAVGKAVGKTLTVTGIAGLAALKTIGKALVIAGAAVLSVATQVMHLSQSHPGKVGGSTAATNPGSPSSATNPGSATSAGQVGGNDAL